MNNFIEISNLNKSFDNFKKIKVLKKISYNFQKGKIYSLMGPSGSGKSTLLNLLSLIDRPSSGSIKIENKLINFNDSNNNDILRAKKIGITDLKKKYNINDMIKGDVIFCATGVTDGDMLKGIINKSDSFEATSYIMHKSQKLSRKVTNIIKK